MPYSRSSGNYNNQIYINFMKMVQSDIPKAFNIGQVSYLVEDPATGDILTGFKITSDESKVAIMFVLP